MIDWLMNVYIGSLVVTALHGLAPVSTILPDIAYITLTILIALS